MTAAKKFPAAQVNGGQWKLVAVFETKDGVVVEGTTFECLYAESHFNGDVVKANNVGALLRLRTREVLRRAGLR